MTEERDFFEIQSVSMGRHSDVVESSICTRAVKKVVLIDADSIDGSLYVETVCADCGTIEFAEHAPDQQI